MQSGRSWQLQWLPWTSFFRMSPWSERVYIRQGKNGDHDLQGMPSTRCGRSVLLSSLGSAWAARMSALLWLYHCSEGYFCILDHAHHFGDNRNSKVAYYGMYGDVGPSVKCVDTVLTQSSRLLILPAVPWLTTLSHRHDWWCRYMMYALWGSAALPRVQRIHQTWL